MSLFSKLFGGRAAPKPGPEPIEHNGFLIYPGPIKEAGGFRIGARIEKEIGGNARVHELIRADVISDFGEAEKASIAKARQIIDERGDALFG